MTPCPTCHGASLADQNDHASRTGCRSYRLTRTAAFDTTPPVTRPAAWLAREFPLPTREDRRGTDRFPARPL